MAPSLVQLIQDFQTQRAAFPFQTPSVCGVNSFPLLLAALPALRIIPGLATVEELGTDYFTTMPFCPTQERRQETLAFLRDYYGIARAEDLAPALQSLCTSQDQYQDFQSFWDGSPAFDLEELEEGPRQVFQECARFARQFQPLAGRRGFLAWDISEAAGLLRVACACGLISQEEFRQHLAPWLLQTDSFHSWTEYAVSLLCGSAYCAYRMGCSPQETADFVILNRDLVLRLFQDGAAWAGRLWYHDPGRKTFRLSSADIRPLLLHWEGPAGCLASDRITVDGAPVGYCYRTEPAPGQPDSGWCFFAGDETPEYLEDPAHSGVYHLNTICNYDPDILPLLESPCGTAWARGEDGKFYAEPFDPPEA